MALFRSPLRALVALAVAVFAAYSWPSSRLLPINPGDAIVVTGSSSGIGRHAALSLAREGYAVFACVRKSEDGDALLRSAETFGVDAANIKPIVLDVTDSEHIARAAEAVASFVGDRGLRGLFNNAGIMPDRRRESSAVEYEDMAQYRRVYDVNFFGLVEVTQAFLPLLRRFKGGGRVVMNASVGGFCAIPFVSVYTSSKHAVEGFSDALRREVRPHGVRVSVIEAGPVGTKIMDGYVPRGIEPYAEAERSLWRIAWKNAIGAPSPRVTSEAVLHAMRAENPRIRYVVGKAWGMAIVLKNLPSGWVDAVFHLMSKYGKEISDAELKLLLEHVRTEFTL